MPFIQYDWDEEKRLANLRKHKLDFNDSWRIYEHPAKITLEDEYSHEERLWDLAEVKGRILLLVYTLRGDEVRCISFRVATRREEVIYYEEVKRR